MLGNGARLLGAAYERIPPSPAGVGMAYAWAHDYPIRVHADSDEPEARSA